MESWRESARVYLDRRIIVILFLGFSSGLPFLLVFSTLSIWLKIEGVSLTAIGLFSLVRTPYTFKFLWAPLIDRVPLPVLGRLLGRRRGWAILTQAALMAAVLGMAGTSPADDPGLTALFALFVAFTSASQDIVIDAYRVEILEDDRQAAGAGVLVLGYRVGLLTAGAGALWLASVLPWSAVYTVMAGLVAVGMVTILLAREPQAGPSLAEAEAEEERRIERHLEAGRPAAVARLLAWLYAAVVAPFVDFMTRPRWLAVLAFIMLYKLGDAYLGVMANPFYVEMGFSTVEIANVSKLFGFAATIVGALLGGVLVHRWGILRGLMFSGVLAMLSNLAFVAQAMAGHDIGLLAFTIAVENVSGGMATTAFVAYLSSLCSVAYTATQYALLSSFMAFARDVLSSTSGWAAEQLDWVGFFLLSTAAAVPGLILLGWLMRRAAQTPDQA